jgi:hypothetical protein
MDSSRGTQGAAEAVGTTDTDPWPAVGDLVKDTRRNRVAVVMSTSFKRYFLRPPEGGVEWEQDPAHLARPSAREELSVRLKAQNHQSTYGARF